MNTYIHLCAHTLSHATLFWEISNKWLGISHETMLQIVYALLFVVVVVRKKRVAAQITPLPRLISFLSVFIIEIQIIAFEMERWQAAASAAVASGACVSSFSLILWKLTFCYLISSKLIRLVCCCSPSQLLILPVYFSANLSLFDVSKQRCIIWWYLIFDILFLPCLFFCVRNCIMCAPMCMLSVSCVRFIVYTPAW